MSEKLTAKHLSVALNAVVGISPRVSNDAKRIFFDVARARARALYAQQSPLEQGAAVDATASDDEERAVSRSSRNRALNDIRALSLTLNALSKADVLDADTARVMGPRVADIVQQGFDRHQTLEGQYVGLILNAYSRAGVHDV